MAPERTEARGSRGLGRELLNVLRPVSACEDGVAKIL